MPEDRTRRPDVAFISFQRWPKGWPLSLDGDAWDVLPNLCVAVVSPSDPAEEIQEKVAEYLRPA